MSTLRIGFIGQGYVGKHSSDDMESRGHKVTRYALEAPYNENKDKVKDCDIVFIAVPTPTTPGGFDSSIVESVIPLTKPGATIIFKSTLVPGTTRTLQKKYADRVLFFSPEFLSEVTAAHDAAHPIMNVIGVTDPAHKEKAEQVMKILPESSHNQICSAEEAEIIKYAHNIHGFIRIIFSNLLYDLAQAHGATWEAVKEGMDNDPFIGRTATYTYTNPVHKSGRGAGGNCFLKDMAAFARHYREVVKDKEGGELLRAFEEKNLALLKASEKSLDIIKGIYGTK